MKKMFNEGNQIHNFMSCSSSGTVINYGSGSGSNFLTSYGSGSGSTSQKWFLRFWFHNTAGNAWSQTSRRGAPCRRQSIWPAWLPASSRRTLGAATGLPDAAASATLPLCAQLRHPLAENFCSRWRVDEPDTPCQSRFGCHEGRLRLGGPADGGSGLRVPLQLVCQRFEDAGGGGHEPR